MLPSTIANLDPNKVLATAKNVTNEDMPGVIPKKVAGMDPEKMNVRYQRLNLTNPGDLTELERIETRAIRNKGIYVMSRNTYTFTDQMFMVIGYIEIDA